MIFFAIGYTSKTCQFSPQEYLDTIGADSYYYNFFLP